jgi:hypothetical protein
LLARIEEAQVEPKQLPLPCEMGADADDVAS